MATDEKRPPVPGEQVLRGQLVAPLPEGTQVEAAFLLVKLDDGNWCARQIGDSYNRSEFLGQLSSYTHGLLESEARDWLEDEDDELR